MSFVGFPVSVDSPIYTRPTGWLDLPDVVVGEEKIVGLYAIFDTATSGTNHCALLCRGDYSVDWGDGTVEEYADNTKAEHTFEYTDFGAETDSGLGYRQSIITVIPQSGNNFTEIDFAQNHSVKAAAYSPPWLDIKIAGENVTTLVFYNATLINSILEQFEYIGNNSIEDFSYMFFSCFSLQSILQLDTSSGTNFSNMFYSCYSLKSIPKFDTSAGINFSEMFIYCYSLQSVPQFNTSNGTNFGGMFTYCLSVTSAPQLDTSIATSVASMFCYCFSLKSIPQLDTSSATGFDNMFYQCCSLQSIPQLDTSSGTSFASMFGGCGSLQVGRLNGTSTANISYASCRLSRVALVDIFTGLAAVVGLIITITGNFGAADLTAADRLIATSKGWTISG